MQGRELCRAGLAWRRRAGTHATRAMFLLLNIAFLCGVAQGAVVVRRHVVGGGGASSSNGAITLHGTAGQSQADALDANAASVHLQGGYWAVAAIADDRIFANGFEP